MLFYTRAYLGAYHLNNQEVIYVGAYTREWAIITIMPTAKKLHLGADPGVGAYPRGYTVSLVYIASSALLSAVYRQELSAQYFFLCNLFETEALPIA